jgi:hypothetical protein
VWRGALDTISQESGLKRVAGVAVVLATAFSLSRVLLPWTVTVPGFEGRDDVLATSAEFVPVAWIVALVLVVAAWSPARENSARVSLDDHGGSY